MHYTIIRFIYGNQIISFLLSVVLIAHLVGIFVERWLFFAEAKHVVSTYYTDKTDETSPDQNHIDVLARYHLN